MSLDRDAIIANNPLLPYCEARGWQLRRDGRRWKCLCPLHEESTPSFTVDAEKNLWNCFGCGKGGSVIDLHARLGGMTIGEAMRDLSPEGGNDRHSGNGSSRPDCARRTNTGRTCRRRSLLPSLTTREIRHPGKRPATTTRTQPGRSFIRWCATSRRLQAVQDR